MSHHQAAALVQYLHEVAINTQPDSRAQLVSLLLAVGTFLTFAATAFMAWKTAELAKDTVNASVLADIHHQESQSGLVVWLGDRHIDFVSDAIVIRGYLANVGPGTATNISIGIKGPEANDTYIGVFIPTLSSGSEFPPSKVLEKGVADRDGPLWTFGLAGGQPRETLLAQGCQFTVQYSTIFERQRKTMYPVGSKHTDQSGTHLQYIQEFIDLNRDARVLKLSV